MHALAPSRPPDPALIEALAQLTDPFDVLSAVVQTLGPSVALATSLGPQTLVLLDMLARLGLKVPVFMLDTGVLFPETYALRLRVQARYGVHIACVRPDPDLLANESATWDRDADACCRARKKEPLERFLRGHVGWITGLRRDQGPLRANVETVAWDAANGLVKVAPLAHWSRARVIAYAREHGVPTNPLLSCGYRSVGCMPCTSPVAPDHDPTDERAGRWAGLAKTECGIHWPAPSNVHPLESK